MAKTTLTCEIEYDPEVTDPEGLASAMDRLMETVLSTPGIMDEYANPQVGDFYVMGTRQHAIYCLATNELMTETYGRFTRRDVAQRCIDEADSRIADDLVLVSILGIPNALNCDQVERRYECAERRYFHPRRTGRRILAHTGPLCVSKLQVASHGRDHERCDRR